MPNEIATVRRSLAPTTFTEARTFATELAKSDMVPREYRAKPENILLAMQWGMEVGLAPLQALQNIAIINGKPSVYGDALLALVRGASTCDDVIERFEGVGDDLSAVCEARRIGKTPVISRFSVADAKRAGLWGKTGPWQQYPRRMLQMRARGFALRDAFPDVLRGVITREEAEDYPADIAPPARPMIDVTPPGSQYDAGPAHAAAKRGVESFRAYWRDLDADQRVMLRPDLAAYQRIAEEADRADEDPFGLPPLSPRDAPTAPEAPAPTDGPAAPEHNPPAAAQPTDLLGGTPAENLAVPLARNPSVEQMEFFARQLLAMLDEVPRTSQRTAGIKMENEGQLLKLKRGLPDLYQEVMAELVRKP